LKVLYTVFAGAGYVMSVFGCWGVLVADIQSVGRKEFADRYYRRDLGAMLLWSLLPFVNVVGALLVLCAYRNGWRLRRRMQ